MEFNRTDPKVERLINMCYPNYKGRRKVKVEKRARYHVSDYWDGGSRDYAEFVHLPTNRIVRLEQLNYEHQDMSNPFNLPIGIVNITPDVAVVVNSIFQGKDMGITIYVHPDSYPAFEK